MTHQWYPVDRIVVGRAYDADVQLDDDFLSTRHAQVDRISDTQVWRVFVTDLGTTNGTWVNGRRISGPTELFPGDRLRLGHTERVLSDELFGP